MKKDASIAITRIGNELVWTHIPRSNPSSASATHGNGIPSLHSGDAATLVLSTSDAIFLRMVIPSDDPEEIAGIAANQMEQEAPLDPSEMVFSHEVLGIEDGTATVLGAAASVASVEALREAAGIDPAQIDRVDVAACGLVRVLQEAKALPAAPGIIPLLQVENGKIVLFILENGSLAMARPLAPLETAKPQAIATAVRLALLHANAAPAGNAPLLVLSDSPTVRALGEETAKRLDRECRMLDPASIPPATAGVAIRSLENAQLNLFPDSWKNKLADRTYRRRFLLAGAAGVLLWIVLAAVLYGWPLLLSAKETTLANEVARLAPDEENVNEIRERIRIIERYSDRTFSPLEVLREISLSLPDGLTLTAYRFDAVRREATVEASTPNGTLPAYEFSNRLKTSKLFKSDTFVSGPTESKNGERTTFTMRLEFADSVTASTPEGSAQ